MRFVKEEKDNVYKPCKLQLLLKEFLERDIELAKAEFDKDEYKNGWSCGSSIKGAIKRYRMENQIRCFILNGEAFIEKINDIE